MDGYIFKDIGTSDYNILAPKMWQEYFKMFELHEIMRQRESKDFPEMLKRLREGKHTTEDILKFKERIIGNNSCYHPKDAPHLFVQNAKVNDFNDRAHQAISGTISIVSKHMTVS